MSLVGFSEDPYCRLEMKGKGSSAVVSTNWPDISVQLSDFDARSYHEQLKAYKSLEGYDLC